MMHARNSTREVEAGRSEVQGYLQLPSKLGYRKTCLKKKSSRGNLGAGVHIGRHSYSRS